MSRVMIDEELAAFPHIIKGCINETRTLLTFTPLNPPQYLHHINMDSQNVITVTMKSATRALELIASLENPVDFAKRLEEDIQCEARDADDNDTMKNFLQQPHIMCSGYDADILFFRDGACDQLQKYIASMIEHGVHIAGDKEDEIDLAKSIEGLRDRLGLHITSERIKRYVIPCLLVTKIALRFDIPSWGKLGVERMAEAPDNVFTTQVFKDQYFVLDKETVNSSTRDSVSGKIAGSYLTVVYYCILSIVCSCHVGEAPTMEFDGFFITKMFLPDNGLLCPLSIESLILFSGGMSDKGNEALLKSALQEQFISPSRIFCVGFFQLLTKYLPLFILQRDASKQQKPLGEKKASAKKEEIPQSSGFDNLLLHLTNILPLSLKLTKKIFTIPEDKATVRSTSRSTDMNIADLTKSNDLRDSLAPLLQEFYVKPDINFKVKMSPRSLRFNLLSMELKFKEFWSSSTSGDVLDSLCSSRLLKETEIGSSDLSGGELRQRADQLKFLGCFRQMVLGMLLSRSGAGILTNGRDCIRLEFEDKSELVSLLDGELENIPESDDLDGTQKRRKTEKIKDDVIESGLVKIKNVKLDIFQHGSTGQISSHLAFYVSARMSILVPDVIDPFAFGANFCNFKDRNVVHECTEREVDKKLMENEDLNDQRMCRFFHLLFEKCNKSAVWIALYQIQLKLFTAFSLELSSQGKEQLLRAENRLEHYLENRKGPSSHLVTKLRKESEEFVNAITKPISLTVEEVPFLHSLAHVVHILELLPRYRSSKDDEEDIKHPSTANEFKKTIRKLPAPQVLGLTDTFVVKRLIKGARIPRCHGPNDGISVVLEVEHIWSEEPSILKIFDSVRIKVSDSSRVGRTRVATGFQPLKTGDGEFRISRRQLNASDIIPDNKTPTASQSFVNLSFLALEIYLRETITLDGLRELTNVPKIRRHGYVTTTAPGDLLTIAGRRSSKFSAEGLFIESEKVDHVIEDRSITRAIGSHPRGTELARKVAMRSVDVLNQIHQLGFTHGDIHCGNLLISSEELAGKSEDDVKKVLDGKKEFDIKPFFIDFGASMAREVKEDNLEAEEILEEIPEEVSEEIPEEMLEEMLEEMPEEVPEETAEEEAEKLAEAARKFEKLMEVDIEKLIETLISMFFKRLASGLQCKLEEELRRHYYKD